MAVASRQMLCSYNHTLLLQVNVMCLLQNHGFIDKFSSLWKQTLAWFQSSATKKMSCALLSYYTASSGNFLPTFWGNLLVPYSRFLAPVYPEELSSQNRRLFQVIKEGSINFVCSYIPVFLFNAVSKFWMYYGNLYCFIQFKLNSSQHGSRKYSSASGYLL